jgi:hypothetical protein
VRNARTDTGSIVVGWLVKVALVLFVVGVAGFDGIAVASAHLSASDDANTAASAAASDYWNNHSVASAVRAANDAITSPNEQLVADTLTIARDGSVTLLLRRDITTVVMHDIGPLKKYTVITVRGEAPPPTP